MKKGFTLIELLVVVVVLATLMSIVFRIGNIGGESEKRSNTIQRMQRLENALSGYYAAFGLYPPVKIHGSRDITVTADGNQRELSWNWLNGSGDGVSNWQGESQDWKQVNLACQSQPVSCEFPFEEGMNDIIVAASEELQEMAKSASKMTEDDKKKCVFDNGVTQNIGRHSKNKDKMDWNEVKLFKFGLMSYLLPRYLVIMNGDESFFEEYAQWTGNNRRPCDAFRGTSMSWSQTYDYVNKDNNSDVSRIANNPSQAVCARWMSNFENALACNYSRTIFGVNIKSSDNYGTIPFWVGDSEDGYAVGLEHVYNPDGENGSANWYILDSITMKDGWGNDLYYYSPEPYQSYVVWSAGANGRTFPPWVSREKLNGNANRCVSYWTKDDIIGQSN